MVVARGRLEVLVGCEMLGGVRVGVVDFVEDGV